jgi:hypothetical protein
VVELEPTLAVGVETKDVLVTTGVVDAEPVVADVDPALVVLPLALAVLLPAEVLSVLLTEAVLLSLLVLLALELLPPDVEPVVDPALDDWRRL